MSCNQTSSFDSSEETLFNENDSKKEESSLEIDSLSKETESYSNSVTSNSHRKCMVDTNTTNTRNDCSEINLNPIVWQKFQFLISILKDIQLNIQEMDMLILDHHREDDDRKNLTSRNMSTDLSADNYSLNPLVNAADSSKTDEAKLNEILGLLHRITGTLSSFEQNPLLADELNDDDKEEIKKDGDVTHGNDDDAIADVTDDLKDFAAINKREILERYNEGGVSTWTQTENYGLHEDSSEGILRDQSEERKYPIHRFTRETTDLRNEIEDAVRRKEALDESFKLLFIQRRRQKQEEQSPCKEERINSNSRAAKPGIDSSLNDANLIDSPKASSVAGTEEVDGLDQVPKTDVEDYITKGTIQNEAIIRELRNEENEIPGLAESGLSTEINSLNITIKEILKENQQLIAVCNGFSDLSKRKGRMKEKHLRSENGLDVRGAKPRKKRSSKEKLYSQSSTEHSEIHIRSLTDRPTSENSDKEDVSNLNLLLNNLGLSGPNLKASFDKKIKELLKEQTDIINQLHKDKKMYNEKCHTLERMVAELVRVNRESRMRFTEELHDFDVENCRLEDELHTLQRKNRKLSKNRVWVQSLREDSVNRDRSNSECEANASNCDTNHSSNHDVCFAHIQRLLKEKEIILKDLKQSDNWEKKHTKNKKDLSESYHYISASENDLSSEASQTNNTHKCSSLPVIVVQDESDEKRATDVSNASAFSLNSEMNVLKSRMDYLEGFLNGQINREKSDETSRKSNKCSHCFRHTSDDDDDDVIPEKDCSEGIRSHPATTHSEETSTKMENELASLRLRIKSFKIEKDTASKRMEELMELTRDLAFHFRATREELTKTKRERNFLLEKLKTRSEVKQIGETLNSEETSLKMLHDIEKLQGKCNHLQLEVDRAWKEAHANALEKERITSEKKRLDSFLTSSLANIEEENVRLQKSVKKLEEQNKMKLEKPLPDCGIQNVKEGVKVMNEGEEEKGRLEAGEEKDSVQSEASNDKEERQEDHFKKEEDDSRSKKEEANANWQQSLLWLQRCFVEEKLHNQLLEAAERENSARVAVLQETVQEKGEKYQELLTKYRKLQSMLLASKAEKKANTMMLKECTAKIQEFNSTTTAIEDNYKVMLSSLGNNIGIAVEILSSHLYFAPSQVHPSPDLSVDPAFWFAAQCSRLRWLQSQMRKLCLRSWKGNDVFSGQRSYRKIGKKLIEKATPQGQSLNLDYERRSPYYTLKISQSTPNSPTRIADDVLKGKTDLQPDETSLSSPSSILSSLNDAEINLTNQQVKLLQHKYCQFNDLVGIFKQKSTEVDSISVSARTSDLVSGKNNAHCEIYSTHNVTNCDK